MIELPPRWTVEDLRRLDPATSVVWAADRGRGWADEHLGLPVVSADADLSEGVSTVVAIGGGTLIDTAKVKVRKSLRPLRLVAVPTIWGSGADASPIAVWRDGATRHIEIDAGLVPDAAVFVDEFAYTVPVERARDACGDVWAHAIEGFASPLANDELRIELADLIKRLIATPTTPDPCWFELSALACAGQSQSGVGLVHGLAHTIEDALPDECQLGHARLCRLFLAPVLDINRRATKWTDLFERHGIELDRIQSIAHDLFDRASYAKLLPVLEARWPATLRDPCTRTNAVLVRKTDLAALEAWGTT